MMKLKIKNALAVVLVVSIAAFFNSCDKELSTIGVEVIGGSNTETRKADFNVIAYNRKLNSVRTDGLSTYQLGSKVFSVFGRTKASIVSQLSLNQENPRFGSYNESEEVDDEMETVTAVYLNIPFFSRELDDTDGDGAINDIDPEPEIPNADVDNDGVIAGLDSNDNSGNTDYDNDGVNDKDEKDNGTSPYLADTDNDGINDKDDPSSLSCAVKNFDLDLIYGNKNETFTLKVSKLTDFIQNLDPSTNLEEEKKYFSDDTFNVDATPLFEDSYTITTNNYVIERPSGATDDPNTTVNESVTCETIPAGIRIKLNEISIFQDLLDAEGSDELASNSNFKNYLRGVMIEMDATDLMMVLNLKAGFIGVEYDYKKDGDTDILTGKGNFRISMGENSKSINIFEDAAYPDEVTIDEQNPDNLFVKGGAGTFVELNLFDEDNSVVSTIPENWLINEANLVFYVNKDELSNYPQTNLPERLYLYNITGESTIPDYNLDFQLDNDFAIFDGVLDETDGQSKYKFRITEHINNIIRNNAENVKLGLFLTSNIENSLNVTGKSDNFGEILIPQESIVNPLGTIFYGSNNTVPENNRLKLEIYYTEP